jgi:hypothetical protein
VHLTRSPARTAACDALAAASGGRAGLDAVLADLDRRGRRVRRLGAAVAFGWDEQDSRSPRWWPQGVTSSADAGPDVAPGERYAGRRVLVTSAYAADLGDPAMGARLTFVDLTEPEAPRYRHVLLVTADVTPRGRLRLGPVAAHAGGIVWRGRHVHVAGTRQGIHTFHLDDIVAAGTTRHPHRLGAVHREGLSAFGHGYLLPARHVHEAHVERGTPRFRYSFLSLARGDGPPVLLGGEYGREGLTTRFVRYELDESGLPRTDHAGVARPASLDPAGVARMQGAVEVDGRLYVTTSAGPRGRGSVWSGAPGGLRRHRWVLPAGPEDLAYQREDDRLWTLTEYPGRRVVLGLDRSRFA